MPLLQYAQGYGYVTINIQIIHSTNTPASTKSTSAIF